MNAILIAAEGAGGLGIVDAVTPAVGDLRAEALLLIPIGMTLAVVFWGAPKLFAFFKKIGR